MIFWYQYEKIIACQYKLLSTCSSEPTEHSIALRQTYLVPSRFNCWRLCLALLSSDFSQHGQKVPHNRSENSGPAIMVEAIDLLFNSPRNTMATKSQPIWEMISCSRERNDMKGKMTSETAFIDFWFARNWVPLMTNSIKDSGQSGLIPGCVRARSFFDRHWQSSLANAQCHHTSVLRKNLMYFFGTSTSCQQAYKYKASQQNSIFSLSHKIIDITRRKWHHIGKTLHSRAVVIKNISEEQSPIRTKIEYEDSSTVHSLSGIRFQIDFTSECVVGLQRKCRQNCNTE